MVEIKRKLYRRGSSHETTIPQALLLTIDPAKEYNILFKYEPEKRRWYIDFEEIGEDSQKSPRVLKRRLYSRSGSFETTIPKALLLRLDPKKKHLIIFKYDSEADKWHVDFEISIESGGVKDGKK